MNTLPQPPAVIKVNTDFSAGLDLRNPIEAAAYLKAASHFLSGWPQDWSAERLCLAMVDEESPDKSKVLLWETITKDAHPMDDPYLYVEEFINGLAEDFMMFLAEQSNQ
jgi:hypothetical protein